MRNDALVDRADWPSERRDPGSVRQAAKSDPRERFPEPAESTSTLEVKDTHGLAFWPLHGWISPPHRRPAQAIGGRRPTVAILDTGLADHLWFDADVVQAPYGQGSGPDEGADLHRHGTFVAGIIRQTAPDARILSVELEQADNGKPKDGQICLGLKWLLDYLGTSNDAFVDVVCLAVGYRQTGGEDKHGTNEIKEIIDKLGQRGVLVVAAAGNGRPGGDVRVFPAALADDYPQREFPIVAVGATDVDGVTIADFSIREAWVTRKWVGTTVASTFPVLPPRLSPTESDPTSDVDDIAPSVPMTFTSGFAIGTGTSFAAAGFAGRVAQAMLDNAGHSGLTDVDPDAARTRVRRAMAAAGGEV